MRIPRSLPVVLALASALTGVPAGPPELATEDDKILYTLGYVMAKDLSRLEFSEAQLAIIKAGMTDGALRRESSVSVQEFGPRVDGFLERRGLVVMRRTKELGRGFREKAAGEPGAETTESGLIYRELAAGDGASPAETDSVRIHYHGTLPSGAVFDSSLEKEPVTFGLGGVIRCFREGIARMKVGGKSKLTCPPEIAYGDRGRPPKIRGGETLTFEVELLEIVESPETP